MKILLLTKNVLAEIDFQTKLQELDIEVYCSQQILSDILKKENSPRIQMFAVVILSETLSNQEVEEICPILKGMDKFVLRKSDQYFDEQETSRLNACNLDGWVRNNASKDVLREELHCFEIPVPEVESNVIEKKEKVSLPFWRLTPSERSVLIILMSLKGKSISRKKLATELWGSYEANSFMTRLSTIIKNLRLKLNISDDEQEVIITKWREGYQLTRTFYDTYEIDDQIVEELKQAQ